MGKRRLTPPRPRLSPLASRVMKLVEIIGEGSQRAFATKVGCSHTLISKIVTGQQEPGRALTKSILALKNVDRDWFLTGSGEPPPPSPINDFYVPIADALLPGPPAEHRSLLSSRSEPVPQALFGNCVYAVPAGCCYPAFGGPRESMLSDDRILIDAASDRVQRNVQNVDGRLCALNLSDVNHEAVTLRRVRLDYDDERGARKLVTVLDRNLKEYRKFLEEMDRTFEKYRKYSRDIDFERERSDPAPGSEDVWTEIPLSSIVGVAIQLVRPL